MNFVSLTSVKRLVLDVSPLEEYRINPDYRVRGREWKKPKYVPKCLLSHLETFVWTRYDSRRENEEEVATYILKNARQLKSATFSAKPIEPKIGWCGQGFKFVSPCVQIGMIL
ncbi:hypothetical protein Bca4012_095064 [Brassica carinata]